MRKLILTAIVIMTLAAGVARTQDAAKPADMHAMMASQQHMMASMQASDKKLDDLVAQLNSAKGNDRIDKLVAVVTELVAQRKQMTDMMSMHGGMMMNMNNMMKDRPCGERQK